MKKYEILIDKENTIEWKGRVLHRIKALKDFGDVKKGDLGGFVENENNLSRIGNCWIYNDAKIFENAKVFGDSRVYNNAEIFGYSKVFGYAKVYENTKLFYVKI